MRRFYPGWYVEGFAEYLGATKLRDGNFQLGVRQEGRLAQLQSGGQWLDFEIMLDPKRFVEAVKARQVNAFKFYAQSWLLAHYMLADSARIKAFNTYFENIGGGKDGSRASSPPRE